MKKLVSILLSICLICFLAVTVYAAESISMKMSSSAKTVSRGDTITITVTVSGSADVTQYGLQLKYDTSVFEMVSGSHSVSGAQFAEFNPSRGFAVLYGAPTTPSGKVGTFTLKVKDNAPFGTYTVGGAASAKNGAENVSSSASGVSITVSCKHSFGEWTKVDEVNHKHICLICNKEEAKSHNWEKSKTITPSTCQATGEALYACADCGATKTDTVGKSDHAYKPWTKVDDNRHTHTCSVCGHEEIASHSWVDTILKEPSCTAEGELKYTCSGCDLSRTETLAINGVHAYDHDCDTDCNLCSATRVTSHIFSEEWVGDRSGHWHACIHCGEKQTAVSHIPGAEPTDDDPQTCTACGYVLKPSLRHEHIYSDAPIYNENIHWYPCTLCDIQNNPVSHSFDSPCDTKCNTCGYTRITEHQWSALWTIDAKKHFHSCNTCGAKNEEGDHQFYRGICTICAAGDPTYKPTPAVLYFIIGAAGSWAVTAIGLMISAKQKKKNNA